MFLSCRILSADSVVDTAIATTSPLIIQLPSMPNNQADAYFLASEERTGGTIITFDRPLAQRAQSAILLT